jgi:ClpP class serine protease
LKRRGQFAPKAMLALDPRAWGMFFDAPDRENEHHGQAIVVNVRGPLMHHEDWLCDSYDSIKQRVLEAIGEKPSAIVLSLDSPGGLVSGCFETARDIRAACDAAGIPLYAYVDGAALSAAYALAVAASRIVVPPTGAVGSIGVIDMLVDLSAMNAAQGVRVELVASGARKTDGNPNAPISEDAIAAVRTNVDALAGIFFDHVAAMRGTSSDEVRGLQAAIVVGERALPLKLADEVATLDQMLAAIAEGTFAPAAAGGEEDSTMKPKGSKAYEDAIAALRKAADGDDEEAKKAKRMLAAELAEDDPPAEPEKKDEESKGAKGESDEPAAEKKDDDEAKALAARALAEASKASKATEDLERRQLIASRPDLDESTRELLASSPLEQVRAFVSKHPRKAVSPAAATVVPATRGEGQGVPSSRMPAEAKRSIDQVMGIAGPAESGPRMDGTKLLFPVLNRAERAKYVEAHAKGQTAS